LAYIGFAVLLYLTNTYFTAWTRTPALVSGTVLLVVYLGVAYLFDARKLLRRAV